MKQSNLNDIKTLHKALFERFFDSWKGISTQEFMDFCQPKIEQALTLSELEKRLSIKKKLVIKLGIDPTGPDVHLGHVVPIMLLRQFQKAGHTIHFIIGDFTALIGDPSDRNTERPMLDKKGVEKNMKTYIAQIGRYIDATKIKFHHNSTWLNKKTLKEILIDFRQLSVTEILQREDFRKRIAQGHSLSMAELIYSYAQGIDSVETKADIEVGGRDQLLNFAHGRTIMKIHKQEPEVALVTPVLEGTSGDGRKMSKSYGNYIAVTASSEEKFGKIMSIPDPLILPYFKTFADIKKSELASLEKEIKKNPLEAKKQLAQFLVSIEAKKLLTGEKERERFESRFSKKQANDNAIPEITTPSGSLFFEIIKEYAPKIKMSNSEIRRLFIENAIKMVDENETIITLSDAVKKSCTVRIGKKHFIKIITK